MKITKAMRSWLVANMQMDEKSSDEDAQKLVSKALVEGKLSPEELVKLSTDTRATEANSFMDRLEKVATALSTALEKASTPAAPITPAPAPVTEGAAGVGANVEGQKGTTTTPTVPAPTTPAPQKATGIWKMLSNVQGGDTDELVIRVKEAADQYDKTRTKLTYPTHTKAGKVHPHAGQQMVDFGERGRPLESASNLDKAVAGAYAKLLIATAQRGGVRSQGFAALPQHDRELLFYAMEKMEWVGSSDGGDLADINNRMLKSQEKQALIDDSVSGGIEAAPTVFDDQVIQTPLQHSELFNRVTTIPLERGRRVEGVSTGTVTSSWGGVDDTAIALFNTAAYVSAFDTTIFRWEGAIRIGLDFLSDTPIDFGAHVTSQYGERLLEDLDDVVAVGNGTTQPEGVMNKSGTTSITFGAATSLGNYESLRFGVAKAEHRANLVSSAVFCGTETSYQRARAIPVGASDARRIFGMNYSSYSIMEAPYAINESLTNAQIFYAILARYRMYRRRGLTIRTSTEGDTLLRRNELLVIATARYGGQLERGGVAAVTTDAPA